MTNATKNGAGCAWVRGVTPRGLLAAVLFCAVTSGCEPQEPSPELAGLQALEAQEQELGSENGLSANGLSANGLSANGISANGLSANGLSANGLSANGLTLNGLANPSFASWFANDPAASDMLMRYLVRCAVPAGQIRSFTDPGTGTHYSWPGNLGLAPSWASGTPANLTEQKIITPGSTCPSPCWAGTRRAASSPTPCRS